MIPTTCSNPNCTSRLHFVDDTRTYLKWVESLSKDSDVGYWQDKDGRLHKETQ